MLAKRLDGPRAQHGLCRPGSRQKLVEQQVAIEWKPQAELSRLEHGGRSRGRAAGGHRVEATG